MKYWKKEGKRKTKWTQNLIFMGQVELACDPKREKIKARRPFSLSPSFLFFSLLLLLSQSIRVETKRGRLFINEFQLYGCSPCTDSILFRAYCQIGQVVRLRITLPATLGRVHPLALVAARHLTLTLFKIN